MSDTPFFHERLEVKNHKTINPTPEILDALKQEYPIEASIADLIDNCVDAGAESVLVRFITRKGKIVSLCVADDGQGMNASEIDLAMQFGAKRRYGSNDLGMFGLGMKTASLSQADVVTVLSKSKGSPAVGMRWTDAGIKKDAWRCDVISQPSAESELNLPWGFGGKLSVGTVVRWDNVRDFQRCPVAEVPAYLQHVRERIQNHVGLKLHRILKRRTLRIRLDELNAETGDTSFETAVTPLNPFPTESAAKGYPKKFEVKVADYGVLTFKAHIWPKRSSDNGYKLGSGTVAEYQGLYMFRHNRLVQAGGWNRWRGASEPHLSLARVELDIPDSFASYLRVRSTKAGVDTPISFAEHLDAAVARDGTSLKDFVIEAEEIYRTKSEQKEKPILRPGNGIPATVRDALEKAGAPFRRGGGMALKWGTVSGTDFFKIDRDECAVVLNDRYRSALLKGERGGGADLPMIRTLLYFLLAPTLERERESVAERGRLRAIQSALIAAARMERE